MKKYFFIVILCCFTNSLDAQDLLNQLGKLGKKEGAKKTAQSNASLDSVDFQFTISVNENASFFDVKQNIWIDFLLYHYDQQNVFQAFDI